MAGGAGGLAADVARWSGMVVVGDMVDEEGQKHTEEKAKPTYLGKDPPRVEENPPIVGENIYQAEEKISLEEKGNPPMGEETPKWGVAAAL